MVAGHLQEKNGYFYAVLSYKDSSNKRKTKWIPTGYPVKGNKKKAEAFLTEQRKAFEIPEEDTFSAAPDELFADYLERWLQIALKLPMDERNVRRRAARAVRKIWPE